MDNEQSNRQTMRQRFMKRRHRGQRRGQRMDRLRKGVYILPNFLTSLSLFCGFYAIISTLNGQFVHAAWAIIVAGVFDGLDGRIARMTNTTSRFGVEYDSLADLVAFGVAPAVLGYGWLLRDFDRWGWVAAFLFVACGAMRLARFNVQTSAPAGKGNYFTGLPIPAGAGMVATTAIFCFYMEIADRRLLSVMFVCMIYALAFLMISTIRFQSFKQFDFRSRKPFNSVVIAIMLICIIAWKPEIMLFVMGFVYVVSGPAGYITYILKRTRRKVQAPEGAATEDKDAIQKTIH